MGEGSKKQSIEVGFVTVGLVPWPWICVYYGFTISRGFATLARG